MTRSGVQILWRDQSNASQFDSVAGSFVVEAADGQLVVRHVTDGRVAWKRAHVSMMSAHEKAGALLLPEDGPVSLVRLSDGAPIAKLPVGELWGGDRLLSDGNLTLIYVGGPANPVFVLDSKSRVQPIARHVDFFDGVSRGVLLSRNWRASADFALAPLEAYSLTEFAPPQNRLGPYDKVVSVLEFLPYREYAGPRVLAALRPIPGFSQSLEKIIAGGPAQLKSEAIAVAGLTGDARFVPLLRRELDRAGPETVEQWAPGAPIVTVVDALNGIDSLDAASALFDFWRRIGPKLSPERRSNLRDAVASAIWRYGDRRQWASCPDIVFASSHADPDRALIGTDSPGVEYAVDARRQWAAICEARKDDDGNTRLAAVARDHRDTAGDTLQPYLVIGSGPGTSIDDFVAGDPTGRWIVVTKSMCVYLVDALTGRASALSGADGRPGDTVARPHRAATFSADGHELLYIRSDGSRAVVIQRNLPSGRERRIDPGAGELNRAFFDRSGRFVVMDMIVPNADGEVVVRAYSVTRLARRCRGVSDARTVYGHVGDEAVQRIAAVSGGPVENASKGTHFEPAERRAARYELVARAPAPVVAGTARHHSLLPFGPFRWQLRR
jgi:hypothetical protein